MKSVKSVKKLAILAGVVAVVIAVAGATFLWFYDAKDAVIGSGNAAKVVLTETTPTTTVNFDKVLPGQSLSLAGAGVGYDVNRYSIIKIRINTQDGMGIDLNGDPTSHADWLAAYEDVDYAVKSGVWSYLPKRIAEVLKINRTTVGKDYDYFVDAKDSNIMYLLVNGTSNTGNILSDLELKFTGEFGGTPQSASRQFEQESKFSNFCITAELVQCTAAAVEDVFGAGEAVEIV